jgi:aspartyl-tRNA(Asn)/glutamyl-tRNA(Gln) amidotransferase subunit C
MSASLDQPAERAGLTGSAALTSEVAAYVARLARIELSAGELDRFAKQLGAVLEHASQVNALDTGDVEPTAHPLPLRNVLRKDEPRPSLERDAVLAEAPASEDGCFKVPRILAEER